MNTPAHAIVNLALQTGGDRRSLAGPVVAGALVPDLPMFVFFFWEGVVIGTPSDVLWGESYFAAHWQDFFDVFNSMPLAAVGLAVAWASGRRAGVALFASMMLHHAFDLPLHHDDGHRHFFPLSDFRFASPVSYWDPRHHGQWGALAEIVALAAATAVLVRRDPGRAWRALLVGLVVLQAGAWVWLYPMGHAP